MTANPNAVYTNGHVEAQCAHCGKWFEGQRVTGFFCKASHRVAYHRAQKKKTENITNLKSLVHQVITDMPMKGESEQLKALQEIETLIKRALSNIES